MDISYKADSDKSENGKTVHYRRSIDSVEADLVLFMDVLEHVDDDVGLLAEYVQKAPIGCRFLMTVPAFQFLWSGHDDFLEHRRRYTLKQLEAVVRAAGLKINRGAYYFGMVFPIAAAIRMAQKARSKGTAPRSQLTRHGFLVNGLLKTLCRAELPLLPINRTLGLSAFCLATKV